MRLQSPFCNVRELLVGVPPVVSVAKDRRRSVAALDSTLASVTISSSCWREKCFAKGAVRDGSISLE